MSIELDFETERRRVQIAIRNQLALGHFEEAIAVSKAISGMITEALFETAAVTQLHGPEAGVKAGEEMIRTWTD